MIYVADDGIPVVSVLMPVYNGERYLHQAVDSILGQTLTNFEFIIINDGSTDNTAEILDGYKDPRIVRLNNGKNIGLVGSLNRGLAEARGELIARMDADDVSYPDRLVEEVSFLSSHPEVGLVSTNFYLIDSRSEIIGGLGLNKLLKGEQVEWELYWGNPVVHPSVMFRASLIRSVGGYPPGYLYYAEDYALWLRLALSTKLVVLEKPLLYLRKHDLNVTRVHLHNHIDEVIGVVQTALADRLSYKPPDRCIRLVRQQAIDDPPSSLEITQSINLLVNAFKDLSARHGSERGYLHDVQKDLVRRWFYLLKMYSAPNPFQPLTALSYVLSVVSPGLLISVVGMKDLVKILLGRRLIDIVRGRGITRRTIRLEKVGN